MRVDEIMIIGFIKMVIATYFLVIEMVNGCTGYGSKGGV